MASEGPYLPANAFTSGHTAYPWIDPENVYADDSQNTIVSGNATAGPVDMLVAADYGFAIPSGSIIDGIVVELADAAQTLGFSVPGVAISRDGTHAYVSSVVGLSPGAGWVSYGDANDLWGITEPLTAEEINDPNGFSVVVVGGEDSFEDFSVQLDALRVTIYYTEGTPMLHAYPDADVAANGWTPSSGSDLYAMLDETSASDADFIEDDAV